MDFCLQNKKKQNICRNNMSRRIMLYVDKVLTGLETCIKDGKGSLERHIVLNSPTDCPLPSAGFLACPQNASCGDASNMFAC